MEAASARINLGDLTAGLANAAASVERWASGAAAGAAAARAAHAKKMAELEANRTELVARLEAAHADVDALQQRLADEGALEARLQAELEAATAERDSLPAKVAEVEAALDAEAAAFAEREAKVSAAARARGVQHAATRVAAEVYRARLGLAIEHGEGSRARADEVLYVFSLLDPADPGREGVLGVRPADKEAARALAAARGGGGGGGSASAKAIVVTRCEPPLPAALPGLCARLADPGDEFDMRDLVLAVRKAFVAEFTGGGGRGRRGV